MSAFHLRMANGRPPQRSGSGRGSVSIGGETLVYEGRLYGDDAAARLLRGFQEKGESAFREAEGEFVACVTGPRRVAAYKSLAAPEQVYFTDRALGFALAPVAGGSPRLDQGYLLRYLFRTRSLQQGLEITPFAGVRRLLPGHLLTYDGCRASTQVVDRREYDLFSDPNQEIGEVAREVRRTLEEIVDRRLAAHGSGPVWCEISGGLDSAFVASLLGSRVRGLRGYMFSFPEHPSHRQNVDYARAVARRWGIRLRIVEPRDLRWPDLSKPLPCGDEPTDYFWYGALFARKAADLVPRGAAIFSGFGSDQLFTRLPPLLPQLLRRGDFAEVLRLAREMGEERQRSAANLLWQTALAALPRSIHLGLLDACARWPVNPFGVDDVDSAMMGYEPIAWIRTEESRSGLDREGERAEAEILGGRVLHETLTYLSQQRFVMGPWLARAGVSYETPFCDLRMMDFVFRRVSWTLIHDWSAPRKHLLREAMKGVVPDRVRRRGPDAFSFNGFQNRVVRENRQTLLHLLDRSEVLDFDWIDREGVRSSFRQLLFGSQTHSAQKVLALFGYLLWWRDFRSGL